MDPYLDVFLLIIDFCHNKAKDESVICNIYLEEEGGEGGGCNKEGWKWLVKDPQANYSFLYQ
jgi:hypothetical protein